MVTKKTIQIDFYKCKKCETGYRGETPKEKREAKQIAKECENWPAPNPQYKEKDLVWIYFENGNEGFAFNTPPKHSAPGIVSKILIQGKNNPKYQFKNPHTIIYRIQTYTDQIKMRGDTEEIIDENLLTIRKDKMSQLTRKEKKHGRKNLENRIPHVPGSQDEDVKILFKE